MKKGVLAIFIFGLSGYVSAQGCSDAGFCTVNIFKPNSYDSIANNQIKLGASFGMADHSITILASYLEFNRRINKRLGVDFKLTSISQSGNSISSFGISDLFLNANYSVTEQSKITLGVKVPFSMANKKENGVPLPMDYQSSLGTVDLIFGLGLNIKKLQFVFAIQQPLTQNKNEFISDSYPANSALSTFQSTNKFIRSGDVLIRLSYPISVHHKIKITPSLLPIYHLTNDRYTDALNMEREIDNSEGLTLNANAFLDYNISNKNSLQFNVGFPLVVRESRPDGLTRSFIATVQYGIKF